jgi:hypothetical protein
MRKLDAQLDAERGRGQQPFPRGCGGLSGGFSSA